MGLIRVSALNYYPVKSCAGIALDLAELDEKGIVHDREFMVIEAGSGKYVTQRQKPQMALIRPELYGGVLALSARDAPKIELPIKREGDSIDCFVRDIHCKAIDLGDEAARWLGKSLSGEYRLVRMDERFVRPAGDAAPSSQVGFADAYPLLVISEESLADLNSRVSYAVPMNRFRPNIVIAGGSSYVEDSIKRFSVNGVDFDVVKPCERCAITLVDQKLGRIAGKEPLATLNKFRRNKEGKVEFGQNVAHRTRGIIAVGDAVDVWSYKKEV